VINEDSTSVNGRSAYFGNLASYVQHAETYQFTLNGQKMLPYSGIENAQQKLAMLNDVWGAHIFPQGSQYNDLIYKDNLYNSHNVYNDATKVEANNLVGQMSYGGFRVNQKVEELQLEYARSVHPGNTAKIVSITKANPGVVTTRGSHNLISGTKPVLDSVTGTNVAWATAFPDGEAPQVITVLSDTTFETGVNTTGTTGTYTANSGTVAGTTDVLNLKVKRSKAAFNILFWGEVVKVMSVNNDKVSINIV